MKRVKLFEQFINEAKVPSILSKLGKWTQIDSDEDLLDGTDYKKVSSFILDTNTDLDDYGIIVNIYDDKDFSIFFDSAPIPLSAHSKEEARLMVQTMNEVPLPLSKLNKKELDKVIKDLKLEYLDEAVNSKMGFKTNKFVTKIDEWDWFTDVDEGADESLPKEWHNALKELGINANDAIVCFYDAVGSSVEVLKSARSAGLKYKEVEDTMGGSDGIVFSSKQ